MDAVGNSGAGILGLLGTIGAYAANDGYYDPEAHEAVANTTARIHQAQKDFATRLYGVPEGDFDRRIAEGQTELVFVATGAASLAENVAIRVGAASSARNLKNVRAGDANAPFVAKGQFPPFAPGTVVREFVLRRDVSFVRVHTASNPRGGWLVRADEIAGMTPQQIQKHLALPEVPTHIQTVTAQAGTRIQVGRVGAQPQWGAPANGGVQYRSLDILPESAFGPSNPLGPR